MTMPPGSTKKRPTLGTGSNYPAALDLSISRGAFLALLVAILQGTASLQLRAREVAGGDKTPDATSGQARPYSGNYDELYRPQFHYSAPRGFLADPEMTVYYAGEYHLGYLACDTVEQRAPVRWGHAVQQMGIPCELSLRKCPDGLRLCRWPVRELESLRINRYAFTNSIVAPNRTLNFTNAPSGLADIEAEFELKDAAEFGFRVRGEPVAYNVLDRLLTVRSEPGPLEPVNRRVSLRILVDRMSLEVFGNGGLFSMSNYFSPAQSNTTIEAYAVQGSVRLVSLNLYELRSVWR